MPRKYKPKGGKPGPKPKPVATVRSRFVGVKFSPEEYERVRATAGRLPVATWLRNLAVEAEKLTGLREQVETKIRDMEQATARSVDLLGQAEEALAKIRRKETKTK